MAEVSEEEIVKIHTTVVERFGISDGIINKGNLSSLAARPNIVVNGNEVFPDVYTKAASLLEGIIRWHPFADGNKWTALSTMMYYLKLEGYALALPLSAIRYTIKIAKDKNADQNIPEN